jgi:hypothetical protein
MLLVNLDVCNITDLGNVCNRVVVDKSVKGSDADKVGEGAFSTLGKSKGVELEVLASPQCSIKEPKSLELWTEVVKRGRPRGKVSSRNEKIVENERGLLEYYRHEQNRQIKLSS